MLKKLAKGMAFATLLLSMVAKGEPPPPMDAADGAQLVVEGGANKFILTFDGNDVAGYRGFKLESYSGSQPKGTVLDSMGYPAGSTTTNSISGFTAGVEDAVYES